nr:hypothetical protein [Tanacetum cinerariifolium]
MLKLMRLYSSLVQLIIDIPNPNSTKLFPTTTILASVDGKNLTLPIIPEFLENKAIEQGAGLNWLFGIDSLTKSINYVPVDAGTNSTNLLGTKDAANQEETSSLDNILSLTNRFEDILRVSTSSSETIGVEANVSNMETTISASPTPTFRIHKDHPKSQIIGPVDTPIQTRHKSKMMEEQKPKKVFDALQDLSWVEAMQEELLQFKIQKVWTLVDCPKGVRPIGTKWVLKNKKDERGIVVRNKARLVAQGYTQEERIDYNEDSAYPAKVYKVEKAMYGLHQAPKAWQREDFILVQVYLDDIIFGSSNPQLCREFEALMHEKFQMSAMGELNFFLDVRSSNTPMDKENPWGKDGAGKDVELHLYRSMIGSLMYLTASRPDIMFAVCVCARHQVTPKECHLHAVKRIF